MWYFRFWRILSRARVQIKRQECCLCRCLAMVWVANPDDVILAEITPHLDLNNNNRLFGVISKRVMGTQWDVDRLARVQCVALLAKLHARGSSHH